MSILILAGLVGLLVALWAVATGGVGWARTHAPRRAAQVAAVGIVVLTVGCSANAGATATRAPTPTATPTPIVGFVGAAATSAPAKPTAAVPTKAAAVPTKAAATETTKQPAQASSFKNCAEAWAAGAAPLRRGEPGYASRLDGDKDGVACEKPPR